MAESATFFTPTYEQDLPYFAFLRESIEQCGIDLPHVAVVDHEDLPLFRGLAHQNNLTLLSTRDLLPPELETRRTTPRSNSGGRLATRLRRRGQQQGPRPMTGWWAQQYMKLAAPAVCDTDAIIAVDSDVFFAKPVTIADFCSADGRLHLIEEPNVLAMDFDVVRWLAESMRFLGVSRDKPVANYVESLIPLHRRVLLDMQRYIEEKHQRPWAEAMAEHKLTEYTTYGVYARYVNELRDLTPVAPHLVPGFWTEAHFADFEHRFLRALEGGAKAGMVHSRLRLPVDAYRPVVEKAWAEYC